MRWKGWHGRLSMKDRHDGFIGWILLTGQNEAANDPSNLHGRRYHRRRRRSQQHDGQTTIYTSDEMPLLLLGAVRYCTQYCI